MRKFGGYFGNVQIDPSQARVKEAPDAERGWVVLGETRVSRDTHNAPTLVFAEYTD